MKKTISVLSLILLLAACSEPKMRLRAPDAKEEKKAVVLEKKDTVKTVKP
jgi:putative VirB-like lipoprotein